MRQDPSGIKLSGTDWVEGTIIRAAAPPEHVDNDSSRPAYRKRTTMNNASNKNGKANHRQNPVGDRYTTTTRTMPISKADETLSPPPPAKPPQKHKQQPAADRNSSSGATPSTTEIKLPRAASSTSRNSSRSGPQFKDQAQSYRKVPSQSIKKKNQKQPKSSQNKNDPAAANDVAPAAAADDHPAAPSNNTPRSIRGKEREQVVGGDSFAFLEETGSRCACDIL